MTLEPASGIGANSLDAPIAAEGACTSSGCPDIRIDNNVFPVAWAGVVRESATMIVADNVFGVLDHYTVSGSSNGLIEFVNDNFSAWQGVGQYGDNSWSSPDTFGTAQELYIENNIFNGPNVIATETEGGISYSQEGGGRFAVRFNTFNDPVYADVADHGTETNGRARGGRQIEAYDNTLNCSNTSSGCGAVAGLRSGVGYVFDNKVSIQTGSWLNSFLSLSVFRTFAGFSVWGACDGQGPYDDNDGIVYASGTIGSVTTSGGTLTITDISHNWTPSQWVNNGDPYSIIDTSINTSFEGWTGHPGYEISGSTSDSISASDYGGDTWNGGPTTFNPGDSYEIMRASACIDQPSRSGGTLLSGSTPSPTGWVQETPDPSYEWGDISQGGNPGYGPVLSDTAKLTANRDFYGEVSQSAQTSSTSPFNGTSGSGYGTLANRPATCTPVVAYWATDE